MIDFLQPVYIIRGPDFGSNFEQKLWLSLFAVFLVCWDVLRQKRADYFWVFLTGTIIWSLAEFSLQTTGARVMPLRVIHDITLPLPVSALLQGIAEGAFVAIFGLFVGDRLRNKQSRGIAMALLIGICLLLLFRAFFPEDTEVSELIIPLSRRNIFAPRALVFLACMTAFNVIFFIGYKAHQKRTFGMVLVMAVVVITWTLEQVLIGSRWVEIYNTSTGAYQNASAAVTSLVFLFDIIFEALMAYTPFFTIPVLLGRIKSVD